MKRFILFLLIVFFTGTSASAQEPIPPKDYIGWVEITSEKTPIQDPALVEDKSFAYHYDKSTEPVYVGMYLVDRPIGDQYRLQSFTIKECNSEAEGCIVSSIYHFTFLGETFYRYLEEIPVLETGIRLRILPDGKTMEMKLWES